jgi:NADH/F420H2 dehydrogenase subunit C
MPEDTKPTPDADAPGSPKPVAASKPPAAKPAAAAKAAGPPLPPDPPPPDGVELPAFIQALMSAFPDAGLQISYWVADWTVIVPAERLLDIARFLREVPAAPFDFCSDVTATDWPARPDRRFDVVYCLYSTTARQRVRMKTRVGEQDVVASVTGIWPAANWLEREIYDMFGVRFAGHPDLRRILMPEDWQGYPERKDYPLEGPGELILESPQEWLKLRQAAEESEIE